MVRVRQNYYKRWASAIENIAKEGSKVLKKEVLRIVYNFESIAEKTKVAQGMMAISAEFPHKTILIGRVRGNDKAWDDTAKVRKKRYHKYENREFGRSLFKEQPKEV